MNNNKPSDSLSRLGQALIALLRSKLNVTAGGLGLLASITIGKLVWGIIILFLLLNILFLGNIALGLYFGYLLGNMFYGFGALTLGYIVLALFFFLIRGAIQHRVQNRVARSASTSIDKMNASIDSVPALRVAPIYRDPALSSASQPLEGLERRVLESNRRAAQAQAELLKEIDYLKLNYKFIAADMADKNLSGKIPAYGFISGLIHRSLTRQQRVKNAGIRPASPTVLSSSSLLTSLFEKASAVLPYSGLIFKVIRPVLTAVALSKTRTFLARLLGLNRRF